MDIFIQTTLMKSLFWLWTSLLGVVAFNYKWAASWENQQSAYAKTKTQISFAVTAKLISASVFATWIVQSLPFLNTKFQASSHHLWLYSLVCVGPSRKPWRSVFSERGSIIINYYLYIMLICTCNLEPFQMNPIIPWHIYFVANNPLFIIYLQFYL